MRHIKSSSETDNIEPDIEIFSDKIRELYNAKSKITNSTLINSSNPEEDIYSVKSLNLSISKSSCGCLLKNWDDIAGRDKSPQRGNSNTENAANKESVSNEINTDSSIHETCRSPDLFDSDDEHDSENKLSRTPVRTQNDAVLTTVFKSNSGIAHFESVCEDSLTISRQINQLLGETSPSYSLNTHKSMINPNMHKG